MEVNLENLHAYLVSRLPNDGLAGEVRGLDWLPGGWESALVRFRLVGEVPRSLVLRIYPSLRSRRSGEREYTAMQQLHRVGYPVPRVYAFDPGDNPFQRPFLIMDFIDGQTLWSVFQSAAQTDREALLGRFCELFVRLHALDWREFTGEQVGPYHYFDSWMASARSSLAEHSLPGVSSYFEWLASRREALACPRPAPVHSDFHPLNVILRPDGEMVVIDWTSFAVSDPRMDLGWALMLAYAYGGDDFHTALLEGYAHFHGQMPAHVDAFVAIACLQRLFHLVVSLQKGSIEMGMRPEAVDMMREDREAHRRVYALLRQSTTLRSQWVEAWLDDDALW